MRGCRDLSLVAGGARTRVTTATTIPVARPLLDEREAEAARRVILSGWVTQGPEVAAFEQDSRQPSARRTPARCRAARPRCTWRCWRAACRAGDEVVTVSHSFIATANAIRYCGATPVFVDIEPETFNIDPALVEAAIGPRTKAILAVHQLGMPCDLAAIARDRQAAIHAGHRGCRLRHRQRDPLERALAAHRPAARATSPASRFIRASCCRPATAAC